MDDTARDRLPELRSLAQRIYAAALAAADPGPLVRQRLQVGDRSVIVDGVPFRLGREGHVLLLAAGKAAAAMALAAMDRLGPLVGGGLVVVRDSCPPIPGPLAVTMAGHPLPDLRSAAAAERMLELAGSADQGDLVLCLFSGGASALLSAPAPPLLPEHLIEANRRLIACGADIGQINSVRKHLSAIKGGRLARAVQPAMLATLLLSDVTGDAPGVIASGPTSPDPTRYSDALSVVETFALCDSLPRELLHHLRAGADGAIEETPGPDDPCFRNSLVRVVGSNAVALASAAAEADRLGCLVRVRQEPVVGEARQAAAGLVPPVGSAFNDNPLGITCFISGGETVVTLPGGRHGLGGRNMELALAAAPLLPQKCCAVLLSAATDGSDGPTTAAGAMVDISTLSRAAEAGLDCLSALLSHDAYPFFRTLGDLVVTGPTGTNVQDIQLLLVEQPNSSIK